MRKTLSKVLTILSSTSIVTCPLLTSCGGKTETVKDGSHLMCLSDIHGELPGYGDDYFDENSTYAGAIRMADAMQEIAEKSKDSVILAGGDQNGSGTFSSCSKGDTMYPVLKAMDIRYSAVGNHAWEWGKDKLVDKHYDNLAKTDKTVGNYFVTSNVLNGKYPSDKKWVIDETKTEFAQDYNIWKQAKVDWADPYKMISLDNHNICLIGLTTLKTNDDGNQKELLDTYFLNYIPAVHYTKHFIKEKIGQEKFDQIDSFILFTHCGANMDGHTIAGEVGELAYTIDTPVDAILAAHTHTDICGKVYNNKFSKPVVITETKDKMQTFADLKFNFDDSKPAGQRLVSIEPKIITPDIKKDKAEAKAQLDNIIAHPRNQIVKNTCDEYLKQKDIAKSKLKEVLGHSNNGMAYLQKDNLFDYKYPVDFDSTKYQGQLVEQIGAFVGKSHLDGINRYIDTFAESEKANYKKANIAYIGNSCIRGDVDPNSDITLREAYDLIAFENFTVTASLTYYQLEQLIDYMFTGASFEYQKRHDTFCTDEYQYERNDPDTKFTIPQLRYPYGPNQFYGFAFSAKQLSDSKAKDEPQGRRFQPVRNADGIIEIKIYDPDDNECVLDDPSTWKGKDHWENEDGSVKKYITICMNSFDFFEGNKMNKMIYYFSLYNSTKELAPEPKVTTKQFTNVVTRILFSEWVKIQQKEKGSLELPADVCKQLIKVVK